MCLPACVGRQMSAPVAWQHTCLTLPLLCNCCRGHAVVDHFSYDAATGAKDHAAVLANGYVKVGRHELWAALPPAAWRPALAQGLQERRFPAACWGAAGAALAAPHLATASRPPCPTLCRARRCCRGASRRPSCSAASACRSGPPARRCVPAHLFIPGVKHGPCLANPFLRQWPAVVAWGQQCA